MHLVLNLSMTKQHFIKHLRVLFTLLGVLTLLSYSIWIIYGQLIEQQHPSSVLSQNLNGKSKADASFSVSEPTEASNKSESSDTFYSQLTALDLMNVQEVINRALSAVMFNESNKLILLQAQLLDTAKQLNLPPSQIDFINSPQALNFMRFRAKRAWFSQEVEKRYLNIQSLDGLLKQFPEARGDLYQTATELIIQRDAIIFNIAKQLAGEQQRKVTENDINAAKLAWLDSLAQTTKN